MAGGAGRPAEAAAGGEARRGGRANGGRRSAGRAARRPGAARRGPRRPVGAGRARPRRARPRRARPARLPDERLAHRAAGAGARARLRGRRLPPAAEPRRLQPHRADWARRRPALRLPLPARHAVRPAGHLPRPLAARRRPDRRSRLGRAVPRRKLLGCLPHLRRLAAQRPVRRQDIRPRRAGRIRAAALSRHHLRRPRAARRVDLWPVPHRPDPAAGVGPAPPRHAQARQLLLVLDHGVCRGFQGRAEDLLGVRFGRVRGVDQGQRALARRAAVNGRQPHRIPVPGRLGHPHIHRPRPPHRRHRGLRRAAGPTASGRPIGCRDGMVPARAGAHHNDGRNDQLSNHHRSTHDHRCSHRHPLPHHHPLERHPRLCPLRRVRRDGQRTVRPALRRPEMPPRPVLLPQLVLPGRRRRRRRPLVRRGVPARVRQVLGQRDRPRELRVPDCNDGDGDGDVAGDDGVAGDAGVQPVRGVRGDEQRAVRAGEWERAVPGRVLLLRLRVLPGRRRQRRRPLVRRWLPPRLRQMPRLGPRLHRLLRPRGHNHPHHAQHHPLQLHPDVHRAGHPRVQGVRQHPDHAGRDLRDRPFEEVPGGEVLRGERDVPGVRGRGRRPVLRRRMPEGLRRVPHPRRPRTVQVPGLLGAGRRGGAQRGPAREPQRAVRGGQRVQVPGQHLLLRLGLLPRRRLQQRAAVVRAGVPAGLRQMLRRRIRLRFRRVPDQPHHPDLGHGDGHRVGNGDGDRGAGPAAVLRARAQHRPGCEPRRAVRVHVRHPVPTRAMLQQFRVVSRRRGHGGAGLVRSGQLPGQLRQVLLRQRPVGPRERVLRRRRRRARGLPRGDFAPGPQGVLRREHAARGRGADREPAHLQEQHVGGAPGAGRGYGIRQRVRGPAARVLCAADAGKRHRRGRHPGLVRPLPARAPRGVQQRPGDRAARRQRHLFLLHRVGRRRRGAGARQGEVLGVAGARVHELQGQHGGHHVRRRAVQLHRGAAGRAQGQERDRNVLPRRLQELRDRGLLRHRPPHGRGGPPDRPAHVVPRQHPLLVRHRAGAGDEQDRDGRLRRRRPAAAVQPPPVRGLGHPVRGYNGEPGLPARDVEGDDGRLVVRGRQRRVRRHGGAAARRRAAQQAERGAAAGGAVGADAARARRGLLDRFQPHRPRDRPPPRKGLLADHLRRLPGGCRALQGRRPLLGRPRPRARGQRGAAAAPRARGPRPRGDAAQEQAREARRPRFLAGKAEGGRGAGRGRRPAAPARLPGGADRGGRGRGAGRRRRHRRSRDDAPRAGARRAAGHPAPPVLGPPEEGPVPGADAALAPRRDRGARGVGRAACARAAEDDDGHGGGGVVDDREEKERGAGDGARVAGGVAVRGNFCRRKLFCQLQMHNRSFAWCSHYWQWWRQCFEDCLHATFRRAVAAAVVPTLMRCPTWRIRPWDPGTASERPFPSRGRPVSAIRAIYPPTGRLCIGTWARPPGGRA